MKRFLIFLVLAWSLSAWARAVSVTVATPANGATVTSPVPVKASATSTHGITGWRIYVDGVSVYQAGAVNSISTSLTMASGTHKMIVRAWNSVGHYASASLTITVTTTTSSGVTVGMSPTSATLQAGSGTQTFTASVSGSTNTGVIWSLSGIGGLTSSGNTAVYTPPTSGSGSATLKATSVADSTKSASAQVTVTAPSSTVSVSISPTNPTVQASASQQFTATVSGTTNTAVNWLVNGVTGGNSSTGTISSSGLYTAPVCPSSSGLSSVKITAQSVYDTTVTSSTTATLTSAAPSGYYFVATNGSDSNSGDVCHPWATLQHAANTVNPGSTVVVEDGTYNQSLYISRGGTATAPITFKSQHKHRAVIAPNGSYTSDHAIISFNSPSIGYVTIKDFDIMDAAASSSLTWGIRALGNHVTIVGNKVHHIDAGPNAPCSRGAAIGPEDYGLVDGNIIYDIGPPRPGTHCYYIHGVYTQGSNTMVSNNIVYNVYQGSALDVNVGGGAHVTNDSFVNNLAFRNGSNNVGGDGVVSGGAFGVVCQSTDGQPCSGLVIANNIVMDNTSVGGQDMACQGPGWTNVTLTNNIRYNAGPDCINDRGSWPGWTNDSTANPLLVNYQNDGSGDYHLMSTSPAINKGTTNKAPNHDYDGSPRPYGGGYDIGAYEWHP